MNIYLIIEVAKRELDSKILLALYLMKFGFNVYITKKSRIFEKLHILDPGILFFKSFGPKYEKYLDEIKKYNHEISGIDEEGLQLYKKESLIGKIRFSNRIANTAKIIFCWGKYSKKIYKNHFEKLNNLSKTKFINSGNPRIDLIKNSEVIYKNLAEDIKKKYGKFILIPTQFLKANPSSKSFNNSHYKSISLSEKKSFKGSINYQKKSFEEFKKLYEFLNKKYPKKLFIIRPHPGEDLAYYQKLGKKFSNIKVVSDNLPINPWLIASDYVISNNCTTAIEAYFIKGNSINYLPYKKFEYEYLLNKKVALSVRSKIKISKILSQKNLTKISKKNANIIENFIYNRSKKNSCIIIAKNLIKTYKKNDKIFVKKNNVINIFFYFFYFIKVKFLNFIFTFTKKNNPDYLNQKNKRNKFTKKEVMQRIKNISKIKTLIGNYTLEEKNYGVYQIKKIN
jgi:surface carbohydrate biosynthesis protein